MSGVNVEYREGEKVVMALAGHGHWATGSQEQQGRALHYVSLQMIRVLSNAIVQGGASCSIVNKLPALMVLEGSWPCSIELAI
jgi:hypothetical protein